ncbi:MAG TPA: hypothetical protein VFH42_02550 [Sporolactobacillaceae bacterium]|nr:hypothetical protein [Sporolactobacillaceae bacterium]
MKRFLKLLSFEFNRLTKMYVVLLCLTLIFQFLGVILTSEKYMGRVNKAMQEGLTQTNVLEQVGPLHFSQILNGSWFRFSIMMGVIVFGLFIFWIWYREWLGKNTFIYRLLMLPMSRLSIYFAKLGAILLGVFGLIAFQLLLLPCEMKLFQWIVPQAFSRDSTLTGELWAGSGVGSIFNIILPQAANEFFVYYAIGIMGVLILFTAILFERSFHFIGIIFGVLYTGVALLVFLAPIIVDISILRDYFYPVELFGLEVTFGLVVSLASVGTSHYLLRRRITV